jgi:hypothetical protein
MKYRWVLFAGLLLFCVACTTVNYESPQFIERAQHHRVIAVLPFEMVLAGNPPKDLTVEQMAQIEEAESVAFQEAYYYRLLNQSSVHRKHPIRIEIQRVETTNRLLAEAGIGIRDSWGMSAKSLASVLEVDAVISTSVQKTRYISGGESFGLDLSLQAVNEVTDGALASILPWGLIKTHDIFANCELIDAVDGAVIWQTDFAQSTAWLIPADQVIAGFTKELAKRFPYRG